MTPLKKIVHALARFAPAEELLTRIVNGKHPENVLAKFIAPNTDYPKPSIRHIVRHDLELELDISDAIGWYSYFGLAEPGHESLLSLIKPKDIILDVGCNIGITAMRSACRALEGKVYAFEATRETFEACQKHIVRNGLQNIEVFHLAIGETRGTAYIHQRNLFNKGMNQIETDSPNIEKVEMNTIDSFCLGRGIKPDLIKIDTEGYEMRILNGAKETISRHRPKLFLEIDPENLKSFNSRPAELLGYLESINYTLLEATSMGQFTMPAQARFHLDIIALPSA